MIHILTAKKREKLCQAHYNRGLSKGYELGYRMGKTERTNHDSIVRQNDHIQRESSGGEG